MTSSSIFRSIFFFNDTATTEIYTLSLHDALPILIRLVSNSIFFDGAFRHSFSQFPVSAFGFVFRSEEHTSELQSPDHIVFRLLLEKKKNNVLPTTGIARRDR